MIFTYYPRFFPNLRVLSNFEISLSRRSECINEYTYKYTRTTVIDDIACMHEKMRKKKDFSINIRVVGRILPSILILM